MRHNEQTSSQKHLRVEKVDVSCYNLRRPKKLDCAKFQGRRRYQQATTSDLNVIAVGQRRNLPAEHKTSTKAWTDRRAVM